MMINSNKAKELINNIIEDFENGYCPLHFIGPGCENSDSYNNSWVYCKDCIMAWINS